MEDKYLLADSFQIAVEQLVLIIIIISKKSGENPRQMKKNLQNVNKISIKNRLLWMFSINA